MGSSIPAPANPLKVLFLEDCAADHALLAATLTRSGLFLQQILARNGDEFKAALQQGPLDLILSDVTLPEFTGQEAMELARELQPDTPFVLVSGTLEEERVVDSLRSGATDFVLKSHLERLPSVVRRALREAELRRAERNANAQLRASEERFRLLFEYAPDAYYLHDLEGRFVDENKAAEELCGYSRAEAIGKSFFELNLLTPEGITKALGALARNAQGLPAGPDEYRVRNKNGTQAFVEIRTYPVQILGRMLVLGIARDITQRKEAETELRTSEERLRAVWENSSDGMRLVDAGGRVISVNEAYCQMVKLPRERLVGELFTVACDDQEASEMLETFRQHFVNQTTMNRAISRVRLWNSESLDLEISSSFINLAGGPKLALCICRDVTERNRLAMQRETLSQLGHRLSAAKSAREAGQIIIDAADKLLGWDACTFDLYSAAEDRLCTILNVDTVRGQRTEMPSTYDRTAPSPLARKVLALGGQLVLKTRPEQMLPDAVAFGHCSQPSASILLVPIRDENQSVGLLSIHSYRSKAYDQRGLETLQILADHCAGALARIHAHEALENTRRRLDHVLRESPAVIYTLKIERDRRMPVWISNYVQELLGFTAEEACHPDWWSAQVHPEDLPQVAESFVALQERKRIVREYRIRRKDGNYRWVRDEQRLVCKPDGTASEILGSWVDITEGKALEEVQKRLATAAEQSAESILITDVRGEILYANPAFERVSGYSRSEVLGKNPRILKSDKHDAEFYRAMWNTLTRGEVWQGHIFNKRKDGSIYEESATITPVRDADKRIVNFVAVKRDVTHERQLESQLRQAQKMEAIGQLAGGVAHDFNNLLLVMRGNAELLMMDADGLPEPFTEGLKQITSAAERAASLTRQLLAFSRKQVMQDQPLVLNEVIANLTKMLKRIIGEHIDLQCHYGAGLPHVLADPGMVEQVLVNLVINARDAMPEGGQLHVATEQIDIDESYSRVNPESRAGRFVCLSVRDNGSGIAPENLPRIFEPFFTTKQAGKGTGLGLATVYGIVKQHRGWIEVFSEAGAGSTFKVFFPAVPVPAPPSAATQPDSAPRGGTETVLLVEDEQSVRMITRRVLESAGYKVHEAITAREALEKWGNRLEQIALLLTDIVMPEGITGKELSDKLRTKKPDLGVILMSGYSPDTAGKNTEFFRRTKTCFLQKPCSSRVLLATVRRVLDQDS